jgi:hypothetical protein
MDAAVAGNFVQQLKAVVEGAYYQLQMAPG